MAKLMCYSYSSFGRELSRAGWMDNKLPSDWAFIEITEHIPYIDETPWLKDCDQVLNLKFDDICGYRMWDAIPDYDWTPAAKEIYKDNYGMSEDDAKTLFEFIEKNLGKNIMVHCSAGVSRSQGVVRFLLDCYPEYYNVEDTNKMNPCKIPNTHVVNLLKREYYKKYGQPFEETT